MPAQASSSRRGARMAGALLLLAVLGVALRLRWKVPGADGPEPLDRGTDLAETSPGSSRQPDASAGSTAPEIVRRALRTAATKPSSLAPADYEHAVFAPELRRLRALMEAGDPVMRDASSQVHSLLKGRLRARARGLGGGGSIEEQADGWPAVIPTESARHPAWSLALQQEGVRHPTFLHDARAEFRRLDLPEEWDDYLTVFLLESVDEIGMLGAVAAGGGPHIGDFPVAVVGESRPVTPDSTLLAAWLHRQATIRLLRAMGVPVDGRFEQVLLNAGLGESLAPRRYGP